LYGLEVTDMDFSKRVEAARDAGKDGLNGF
jgi:hypothetical protein